GGASLPSNAGRASSPGRSSWASHRGSSASSTGGAGGPLGTHGAGRPRGTGCALNTRRPGRASGTRVTLQATPARVAGAGIVAIATNRGHVDVYLSILSSAAARGAADYFVAWVVGSRIDPVASPNNLAGSTRTPSGTPTGS